MKKNEKLFDVVLYGATGFTGKQTAQYFAKHAGSDLKWAIAGRNGKKLEQVKSELGASFKDLPIIEADSQDREAIEKMASQTKVLLTTVGPYLLFGELIVEACVKHGTDYVDITGETPFVRKMIDQYHDTAKSKGIRIISFCGFDSIPSDIGVFVLADQVKKSGDSLSEAKSFYTVFGGGNTGTIHTSFKMAESGLLDQVLDPILLNPDSHQSEAERQRNQDPKLPVFDRDLKRWTTPFFMAQINTRVVRRSNALYADWGQAYGDSFRYQEYWKMPPIFSFIPSASLSLGTAVSLQLIKFPQTVSLLKKLTPAPGKGPSEFLMDNGFFKAEFIGTTSQGKKVKLTFKDSGDPNNRVTVKCLCESALTLIHNRADLPQGEANGGVLTPATGLGFALVDRLKNAGMQFEFEN